MNGGGVGPKGPTINQMQNQSIFPSFSTPTSALTTGYSGGLAQPLIVPPIMPLPFNAMNNNSFNQPQMHQPTNSLFNTSNNSNNNSSMLGGGGGGGQTATNPFLMM